MQTNFIDVRAELRGMTDEQAIRKRADWFKMLVARAQQSPTVREAAFSLKNKYPENPFEQLQALHVFVRDGIQYVNDPPEGDLYSDAARTLRIRQGDCDDKSILFCSIAKLMEYHCGFRFMAQGFNYIHVFPYAFLPSGQKIYFETTLNKPFNCRPTETKSFEARA
jgi:hypothetical protein